MKTPRIELICVGTELLTGKVNTHTAFLGSKLGECGLRIARDHSVGDDEQLMKETFSEAWRRSDVVITAGGLGPTFDDITRDVWSLVVRRPLKEDPKIILDIEAKFRSRGFAMPPANRRQGLVLKGADVLVNRNGTAPGQFLKMGSKSLVLLPGPTRELAPMVIDQVLPRLQKIYSGCILKSKTFLIVGVPESTIDQIIRPFVDRYTTIFGCRITHAILASHSIISVKFIVQGSSPGAVEKASVFLSKEVKKLLGDIIFGTDKDTLESVIGSLLRKKKRTLAVAESCTGGLVSKILTDQPGASDYFIEGVVTYQNKSKMRRLGVRPSTLAQFGAVSEKTAREMAEGLKRKAQTHYALSITGIAGPDGGTKAKPVGLVYIGCVTPAKSIVKEFRFTGDRDWIRHRSALMALDILRRELIS